MLTDLAAWYLSKRKVSVIIGYDIRFNRVQAKHNKAFIYGNNMVDVNYKNPDGSKFKIPSGKFRSL